METEEALVSIIVPVWNSERFLEKCLSSLFKQTYSNIEIITVNNGSKDKSAQILKRMAAKDERVRIVTKKYGVAGSGRNAGLRAVRGQYIMFVDSDDYVAENYVERLLSLLLEYDAEIAQSNFYRVIDGEVSDYLPYKGTKVFTGRELSIMQAAFMGLSTPQTVLWNKIYRKEVWDNLWFTESTNCEDMFIAHELLYPRKRIVWTSEPLYYWVLHKGNVRQGVYRTHSNEILAYERRVNFFKEQRDEELTYLNMKRCYYVACQHIYGFRSLKKKWRTKWTKKREQYLRQLVEKYYPQLMQASNLEERTKRRIQFIRKHPAMFGFISTKKKVNLNI